MLVVGVVVLVVGGGGGEQLLYIGCLRPHVAGLENFESKPVLFLIYI